MIESLRYKLRCFGIPAKGPAELFCDNISVIKNLSIPTSALKKRRDDICYHRLREAQAAGVLQVGWIPGEFNLADLFTKTGMPGNTGHNLIDSMFSNKASPNGDIDKEKVHLYMGKYKYIPHYKSSRRKWFLVLHIYFIQINHLWLSI